MITELRISNPSIIDFKIKTDLPSGATAGPFTVMDIEGMTDAQIEVGMGKIRVGQVYTLEEIKVFASHYNLKVQRMDVDGTTTVVDDSDDSDSVSYIDID